MHGESGCFVTLSDRTDVTDLSGLFVINAHANDADGDDFFLLVNMIRTDVTDLHGLFVKCSRDDADGDDFLLC